MSSKDWGREPSKNAKLSLDSWEEMAAAVGALFSKPIDEDAEAAFKDFLDFAVRFSGLSIYHAMLVRIQRPGATAVGTVKRWAEVGRKVKQGAIPIVLLRPFGPVSLVFEVSDTYGKSVPGDSLGSLRVSGDLEPGELKNLQSFHAKRHDVVVVEGKFGSALAGTASRFHSKEQPQPANQFGGWLIRLNNAHPVETQFGTLTHELGHIFCGHCGGDWNSRWPDRRKLSLAAREVEAETVAALVCARKGLQTSSASYLNPYLDKLDFREISLLAIMLAANRVEAPIRLKKI
jgi:hypothetical protein